MAKKVVRKHMESALTPGKTICGLDLSVDDYPVPVEGEDHTKLSEALELFSAVIVIGPWGSRWSHASASDCSAFRKENGICAKCFDSLYSFRGNGGHETKNAWVAAMVLRTRAISKLPAAEDLSILLQGIFTPEHWRQRVRANVGTVHGVETASVTRVQFLVSAGPGDTSSTFTLEVKSKEGDGLNSTLTISTTSKPDIVLNLESLTREGIQEAWERFKLEGRGGSCKTYWNVITILENGPNA